MLISGKVVGGAAALGIVVALWEKIKELWYKIYSLVIITMKVEGPAGYAMSMYLVQNFKRSKLGDREYSGYNEYVRPARRNQLVALKRISSNAMLWWRGKRALSVTRSWETLTIKFIRWTFDSEELMRAAVDFFNNDMFQKNKSSRFFVTRKQGSVGVKPMLEFMKGGGNPASGGDDKSPEESKNSYVADKYTSEPVGYEFDDIGQPITEGAVEILSLTPEVQCVVDDIRRWYHSEEWFKSHMVPWKFGARFDGIPGTGKTAVVRALGQELGMPVFIFDLATMNNQDLVEAWGSIMDWSPCIVLIEDIHAVFHGTENVVKTGQEASLSFDCLLNVIDGVENTEGVLTIITTNDASKVADALGGQGGKSLRPGRVNKVVKFDVLDEAGRLKMAKRILKDFPGEVEEMVNNSKQVTGAQFQDVCSDRALELWEKSCKGEKA